MMDERIKDKKFRKARCKSRDEIILPIASAMDIMPPDYPKFLAEVKEIVSTARTRAIVSANVDMTLMYWRIGKVIVARQDDEGWGAKVIDRLSYDLKRSFPGVSGFSPRNLKYMRKFALAWPDEEFVQRTVAQIAWRSNLSLLDKLESPDARLWYAHETAKNGWSKDTMRHPSDAPTIGLLLVKEKNDTIVRYSLEGMKSPMGVAEWQTAIEKSMPEDMKSVLPTIESIEAEMAELDATGKSEQQKSAQAAAPRQLPLKRAKSKKQSGKRK